MQIHLKASARIGSSTQRSARKVDRCSHEASKQDGESRQKPRYLEAATLLERHYTASPAMNPYQPPSTPVADQPSTSRERPWFVTGWLWFMLLANSLSAASYLFFAHAIQQALPHISELQMVLLGLGGVANIVFCVAILRWKKWGVWGLLLMTGLAFAFNYWALGLRSALLGLSGFVILVVLLNVGGERRVWPKLSDSGR